MATRINHDGRHGTPDKENVNSFMTMVNRLAIQNNDTYRLQSFIDQIPDTVLYSNKKSETLLHLSVHREVDQDIRELLIAHGADVNALNLWRQSPLHYAAIHGCRTAIETLIQNIDTRVTLTDCCGYNALHCFVSNTEFFNSDWSRIFKSMTDAGIDVNSQTNFGHHVLHKVARKKHNTNFIRFILNNFPDVKPNITDKKGENFLHTYIKSELPEDIMSLFHEISSGTVCSCSKNTLRDLLNQKNYNGLTPFRLMLQTCTANKEDVTQMLELGAMCNEKDNLGNNILVHLINIHVPYINDILEELLKKDIDVNNRNIFGQALSSFLWSNMSFDTLIRHNIDLNIKDRWGCSPLVSVMKWRPKPERIQRLIDAGALIDAQDKYGSTAMHLAAYHDYPEQVELLLHNGANSDMQNNLNETPKDVAIRNFAVGAIKVFSEFEQCKTIYSRVPYFLNILGAMKEQVTLPELLNAPTTGSLLGLPDDMEQFLDDLYVSKAFALRREGREDAQIVQGVHDLVQKVINRVAEYDSRFEMSIFPTGSSAEGTKVGYPDEFDFVLCQSNIAQLCDIVQSPNSLKTGHACLRFRDRPIPETYIPFVDWEGWFLPYPYLKYLFHYIDRAVNETEMWTSGNFYYNFEDKLCCNVNKPVFTFSVFWIGAKHKHLKISIDIVPVVYQKWWWPEDISVNEIPLLTPDVKRAGCVLLLQSPKSEIEIAGIPIMDDSCDFAMLEGTCDKEYQRTMLRISSAPAEISLMKSLPDIYRKAYMVGKIIKTKGVCPDVTLEIKPAEYFDRLYKYKDYNFKKETVTLCKVIKSYMLKNCIFYVAQELRALGSTTDNLSVKYVLIEAFECLLKRAREQLFRPYFLPYYDVFEFKKDEPRSCMKQSIYNVRREIAILFALEILGRDLKPADREYFIGTTYKEQIQYYH